MELYKSFYTKSSFTNWVGYISSVIIWVSVVLKSCCWGLTSEYEQTALILTGTKEMA